MKKLFYSLFGFFFRICRSFPVRRNRVSLVSPHKGGNHDSLMEICDYLNSKGGFEIIFISSSQLDFDSRHIFASIGQIFNFFIMKAMMLATSEYVFLNDNFMPMANLRFSEQTVVTQLWHAEGAFKKFGLMTDLPEDIRTRQQQCSDRLTYVICSSKNVVPVYSKAFGVLEKQVLPLGSARVDYLLREHNTDALRHELEFRHPGCVGKKLILYAPTFRDDPYDDREILSHISPGLFSRELGNEYALLVKLHPQVHNGGTPESAIDVTNYDIADLTLLCDLLITDYSSVCMNFALLNKPCIFFAFDLDKYERERSFCFGYEDYVPGPIVKNFDELIEAIKNPQTADNMQRFREFNFDYFDCDNTKRIVERIISANP